MRQSNLYKVEYTDYEGVRIVLRYVSDNICSVATRIAKFGSDVVVTSIGRVNVLG